MVARKIGSVFDTTNASDVVERLHQKDKTSKWFGVVRDRYGRPVLEDYGRYEILCAAGAGRRDSAPLQFPRLVSFIGVTNAGKSTLIKLLISLADAEHGGRGFPSPVAGNVADDSIPTSGDVHLYSDPASVGDRHPVMYIDCEGFEGGEKIPLGSRSRQRNNPTLGTGEQQPEPSARTRSIEWATTEESRQREFAVTRLYPRILYTFSDCVVFVLRNPKTFQSSVLSKLLDWGAAALEKSINQPTLPHCVVVLNCSDAALDPDQWDADSATQALLSTVRGAIDHAEGVSRFRALAERWRELGRDVCSVEDLVLCYYSSFKVIRLPTGSQINRMREQVSQLRGLIGQCCARSSEAKERARILSDAAELGKYLQSGFDHFTSHLDLPFDFKQVSLARNPIPNDFGDHILQLCLAVQRSCREDRSGLRRLLERMGSFVASCVLLDWAKYRKGRLEILCAPYEEFFARAVDDYLESHALCAHASADGTRRCVMSRARHGVKGHQDHRGIIASTTGRGYVSPVGLDFADQWKRQLKEAMSQLQIDFLYRRERTDATTSDRRIAWDLHSESVDDFYGGLGPSVAAIRSHSTCLSCLIESPQCALPCGHVLCETCARACGRSRELSLVVDRCPLRCANTQWEEPATFSFKSSEAGACALSLDGGGVRGIVQLETLRAIEQALGHHVPVQRLFELIVGAGTGGLIALSLTTGGRSIQQCLDMFLATCDHGYAAELGSHGGRGGGGGGGSVIDRMARLIVSERKAKTSALHGALTDAFTSHRELFGNVGQFAPDARIALVSGEGSDRKKVLLASYRRPTSEDERDYTIVTSDDPDAGPRMWQAAAAAMAETSSFRPVSIGHRQFDSSEMFDSNPVFEAAEEVRSIWPESYPSMVCLSLGTGQNRRRVMAGLQAEMVRGVDHQSDARTFRSRLLPFARRRHVRQDSVLTAERTWRAFKSAVDQAQPHAKGHGLLRLNLDLGPEREPPNHDDHSSLRQLQASVRDALGKPQEREVARRTAHRLVATSFYLKTEGVLALDGDVDAVSGSIVCRFEEDADMIRGLGRVLRDQFVGVDFEPYFEIRPAADSAQVATRVSVTVERIDTMIGQGIFQRPTVSICLDRSLGKPSSIQLFFAPSTGHLAHGYPIGGLPRLLIDPHRSQLPQHVSRKPSSPVANRIGKYHGTEGSESSIVSALHPSMRICWPKEGSRSRRRSKGTLTFSHCLSGGLSEPWEPQAKRSNPHTEHWRRGVMATEGVAIDADAALVPLGLCVSGPGRRLSREHSVLLPPPASAPRQAPIPDLHSHSRYAETEDTLEGSPSEAVPVSPRDTIDSSSVGRSTWTSFSWDERCKSSSIEASEVCMP